jgi:DNA-binding LacI/PurR family transcriptional regulator/DNA-binding transcriptional regulator YhcF (GntR family)
VSTAKVVTKRSGAKVQGEIAHSPDAFSLDSSVSLPDEAPRVRVVRHLKQWIADGVLAPGQTLPSERALARQFGVSNRTVSGALGMLVSEGLLRNGEGYARFIVGDGRRAQLLKRAIVVVTIFSEVPASRHQQSGWVEHIGHGAVAAVQTAGRPAIAIAPEQLGEAEIAALIAERPGGVILTDILKPAPQVLKLAQTLLENDIPVVVYGDAPGFEKFDRVAPDHERGGYLLAQYLAKQGCRRILQMWPDPPDTYWVSQREAGYAQALREAGLEPLPSLVVPHVAPTDDASQFENERRNMAGRLVEHLTGSGAVDGVMTCTDRETFFVAAACRLFGKEPGRDVRIAGYDNFWAECEERRLETAIPAATIDKRNRVTGTALAELLLQRIAGDLPDAPQLRMIEPEVVVPVS